MTGTPASGVGGPSGRSTGPRRLTKRWRVRARFATAGRVAAAAGLLATVAWVVASLPEGRAPADLGLLAQAALVLAAGAAVPWLLVRAVHSRVQRRYHARWQ